MIRRASTALLTVAVLGLPVLSPASAGAARLETFALPSTLVDTSTPGGNLPKGATSPKVHVLLPDGYRAKPKRRYPVLWLLHGAGGGADNWLPGILNLAAGFRGIIVMPDGGRFGMYANWWNGGIRGNPAWATYHLKVLRRVIEHRFRIRPDRRWHAIGGISMGGQGTLRYAAMLPGYFGSAVAFSAAFPDTQSPVAVGGLSAFAAANGANGAGYETIFGPAGGAYADGNNPQVLAPNYGHTRLYLTSGDGTNCPQDPVTPSIDLDAATEKLLHVQQAPFAAAARAAGARVTEVTTCGVHTFGVWDRAFAAARAWGFFRPVAEHPRRWAYRTIATAGEMWGVHFRFAVPPSTVAEFKRSGRTLSGTGSGSVQIRGRRGCHFSVELPFKHRLPRACLVAHS